MRGGVPRFGGRKKGFQREKGNSPKGFSFSLWCAFAYFRRTAKVSACPARGRVNKINCPLGMRATQKITCLSAIIFAFGEIQLVSIINFRLCGEHLLSLHDESRQRRAKEREDNRSERFSSLSLESFPSFDRSRFASAHKCAGAYRHDNTAWSPRP